MLGSKPTDWKSREIFSKLHLPPDLPVVIRVDGWNFHDVSERVYLARPFDKKLAKSLVMASIRVIRSGLPVSLAFSFSDELAARLRGMKSPELHELIYRTLGINMAKIPAWQRRGVVVRRKRHLRTDGIVRRKIVVDWSPPIFSSEEGRVYLRDTLEKG